MNFAAVVPCMLETGGELISPMLFRAETNAVSERIARWTGRCSVLGMTLDSAAVHDIHDSVSIV